jgi:phenylalanyl-tRNA synthetase alpha chain
METNESNNVDRLIEYLSPIEKKILPFIDVKTLEELSEKSNLDNVSCLRALEYLQNKGIVQINSDKKKIIEIGVNGALYLKRGLPERRLLNFLNDFKINLVPLVDAQKQSKLSDDEFKAALGVLKKKALIDLKNGKIILNANGEEVAKKMLEEKFIEALPLEFDKLEPEQKHSFEVLKNRKEIIQIEEKKSVEIRITSLGKKVLNSIDSIDDEKLVEQLTQDVIREGSWKGKKFRRYDVTLDVPKFYGGKRHFVNQAIDHARRIWTDLGFKEMNGSLVQSSFWNFDALFTAQDHPVRELQDTFYIKKLAELPDKKIVDAVKQAHEKGVGGSRGWQYLWNEEDSKRFVLRTHTTCVSAQKLYELGKLPKEERRGKFFALGKNFRNETVDWSHGFEFYQTEGIVVDENVNFRHLLGYLKQFYKKMGFEKIRFSPAYFPYTEPSVEVNVWHPEKKVWMELGGAGIFRPEITIPLLGVQVPVLAWGQGFDRIIMDYYKIKDLRELYKNDLNQLRKMKFWVR